MPSDSAGALVASLQEELDRVAAGFLHGVEAGTKRICHEMFADLHKSEAVLPALFGEKWEAGQARPAAALRATIEDYLDDPQYGLRTWLASELLFGRVVALALTQLVQVYVRRLVGHVRPFGDHAVAAQRVRSDCQEFRACFQKYLDEMRFGKIRSRAALEERLMILDRAADVLADAYPQNHFEELAREFGPFATQAIARLLYLRGDLSREQREDLLLYDVSEHGGAVPRFDLADLPPLPRDADEPAADKDKDRASPKAGAAASSKVKAKARTKMVEALAQIKKNKSALGKEGPTLNMSLNDFLGKDSASSSGGTRL